jgi:hypothetical protein
LPAYFCICNFVLYCFQAFCGCFLFLNDSPSAQKEYTNLLLCGTLCTFALELVVVRWMDGWMAGWTDDTPAGDRGETDLGGLWQMVYGLLLG